MAANNKKVTKKRVVSIEAHGQVHIKASFNNVIISITNQTGQVVSWASAGKMGFRGSKKNTPYAAQLASGDCAKVAVDAGMKKVDVFIKGPGSGRDSAIRTLQASGLEAPPTTDTTPLPHNGCRAPKARRV
jgi:small subunit ribosomal protein S11